MLQDPLFIVVAIAVLIVLAILLPIFDLNTMVR
jgi:type II secretory pathway component PulF